MLHVLQYNNGIYPSSEDIRAALMVDGGSAAERTQQQEGKIKIKNIHIQRKLQVMPKSFFIFWKRYNTNSSQGVSYGTLHCMLVSFIRSESHHPSSQPTNQPTGQVAVARTTRPHPTPLDDLFLDPLNCAFIYNNAKGKLRHISLRPQN